jgi:hypothetical protein
MTFSWRQLGAMFALAFAFGIFANVRADWLLFWLHDRLPQSLSYTRAAGTLFSVRLEAPAVVVGSGRTLAFETLEIEPVLWRLLLGQVEVAWQSRQGFEDLGGRVRYGPGGWTIPALDGRIATQRLGAIVPALAGLQIDGALTLEARDVQLGPGGEPQSGTFELRLLDLALPLISGTTPLGSYRIHGEVSVDGAVNGAVETAADEAGLHVTGNIAMTPGTRSMRVAGKLLANSAPARSIVALTNPRDESGARFEWDLNW